MEPNAPNHVIGTGSLEVKPQMQAVHDEMDRIDRRLDELKEKAGKVFDFGDTIRKAGEELDALERRFKELDLSAPLEKFRQGVESMLDRLERPPQQDRKAPEADSPEAKRMLQEATQEHHLERIAVAAEEISTKLDLIQQNTSD